MSHGHAGYFEFNFHWMGKLKYKETGCYDDMDKNEVISLLLAWQRKAETLQSLVKVYEAQNMEMLRTLEEERRLHDNGQGIRVSVSINDL